MIRDESDDRKEVFWLGDSLERLREFPEDVQDAMGFNLDRIQQGKRSPIAKHWEGPIWELRDDGTDGKTYRLMYVAIIDGEVTVLHCFDKTSRKTASTDSKMIRERLRQARERKAGEKDQSK